MPDALEPYKVSDSALAAALDQMSQEYGMLRKELAVFQAVVNELRQENAALRATQVQDSS